MDNEVETRRPGVDVNKVNEALMMLIEASLILKRETYKEPYLQKRGGRPTTTRMVRPLNDIVRCQELKVDELIDFVTQARTVNG